MRIIKVLKKIIITMGILFFLLILAFNLNSLFDNSIGLRFLAVQSGSMSPNIPTGSLIAIYPNSTYQIGDVISFNLENDKKNSTPETIITHRIIDKNELDEKIIYNTKGDANKTPDSFETHESLILGKTIFHIPYLGYIATATKTLPGIIMLLIVPATILIYSEIQNIYKYIKNFRTKKSYSKKIIIILLVSTLTSVNIVQLLNQVAFSSSFYTSTNIISDNKIIVDIEPTVSVYQSSNKEFVNINLENIDNYSHLNYEVHYQTNNLKRGVIGEHDVTHKKAHIEKIELGTCSTDVCFYDENPHDFQFKIILKKTNGESKSILKTL